MDRNTPVRRFRGWKEIADYLGTSTRSAQRWNACLQLPVHRDKRIHGATVWAQADELDAWRLAHSDTIRQDDEEHGVATSPPAAGGTGKPLAEPSEPAAALRVPPPVSIGGIEAPQPTPGHVSAPPKTRPFPRWALACSVVVILAGVGLSWWGIFGGHGAPAVPRPLEAPGNTNSATAYGLPVSGQRIVLAVRVGGDTARGEVLNGGMLTVTLANRRKVGIGTIAQERGVDVLLFDIETRAGGVEAVRQVGRHHLSLGVPVVIDAAQGLSVELKGLSAKPAASLPSANARPKACCITCSTFTVCATAVGTSCGSCDSEK
jgi:hypothetical protein